MQEPAGRTRYAMGICVWRWSGLRRAVPVERCGTGAVSAFRAGIWYEVRCFRRCQVVWASLHSCSAHVASLAGSGVMGPVGEDGPYRVIARVPGSAGWALVVPEADTGAQRPRSRSCDRHSMDMAAGLQRLRPAWQRPERERRAGAAPG